MLENVIERLASFGYSDVTDSDMVILDFAVKKVTSTIKNDINQQDIPEGLLCIAVDMVVGEFLSAKKAFSPDDLSSLDLSSEAVTELKEGDISVSLGVADGTQTDEQRLDALISRLLTYGRDEFSAFRRIRW